MLNSIPFVGWTIDFILKVSLAIPFWFIWTYSSIGSQYFYFIPRVYQIIPFWHCVGLFMILPILKAMLIPQFVNVNQSNTTK
jgi:hypothetical protein